MNFNNKVGSQMRNSKTLRTKRALRRMENMMTMIHLVMRE